LPPQSLQAEADLWQPAVGARLVFAVDDDPVDGVHDALDQRRPARRDVVSSVPA
jgi:hypothetical protein